MALYLAISGSAKQRGIKVAMQPLLSSGKTEMAMPPLQSLGKTEMATQSLPKRDNLKWLQQSYWAGDTELKKQTNANQR